MEKKLSGAEKEIMDAVWRADKPVCVKDVFALIGDSGRKYTTAATFMTRLEKKGFLRCEKRGNQNYYEPIISRESYLKRQTDDFVREVYDDSAAELIASLCRDRISEEDYRELMAALERGAK